MSSMAKVGLAPPSMDFDSLYRAHFRYVWRTLRRLGIMPSDTPDAAQEVFMVVYRKLATFDANCKVTTWLFAICYRHAQYYRRRRPKHAVLPEPEHDEPNAETPSQEELAMLHQGRERLGVVLGAMTLDQRAVFILYEIEELEGDEIARLLGLSRGTVCSRLRAARAAFWRTVERERAREHSRLLVAGGRS
jgi:RNA polymerase sigma-70 factor, ECF subfamily